MIQIVYIMDALRRVGHVLTNFGLSHIILKEGRVTVFNVNKSFVCILNFILKHHLPTRKYSKCKGSKDAKFGQCLHLWVIGYEQNRCVEETGTYL